MQQKLLVFPFRWFKTFVRGGDATFWGRLAVFFFLVIRRCVHVLFRLFRRGGGSQCLSNPKNRVCQRLPASFLGDELVASPLGVSCLSVPSLAVFQLVVHQGFRLTKHSPAIVALMTSTCVTY